MVVIGGDLSSKRLAFAVDYGDGRVDLHLLDKLMPFPHGPHKALWWVVKEFNHLYDQGALVVLEEPVKGINVRSTIVQAYVNGSVQAAFVSLGAEVTLINNTVWKSEVIGSGHASKNQIAEWVRTQRPELFERASQYREPQDLLDAIGIAAYARVLGDRSRRVLDEASQV